MRAAAADAERLMNKMGIDIALILEVAKTPMHGYQKYETGRAALLVRYGVESKFLLAAGETIVIQVGELNIVSNEDINKFLADLDLVVRMCPRAKWLIGGDLNIGLEPIVNFDSLNWRKQQRKEAAQPVIDSYGFSIWNSTQPTCYHMGYESINDYTLSLGIEVQGWNVVCTPTMDDHQYIEFQVSLDEVNVKTMVQ